jgi:hypothetical protein
MVYFAKYATAWTLHGYQLVDRATGQYKVTPTLAAGDFKIEKDGGAAANLATLPAVAPAGGSSLDIAFSAAEMQGKHIVLRLVDAAGAEWNDDAIHIFTVGDPSAYLPFDLFSGTVALSAASQGAVTGGVWDELVANHLVPDTFGAQELDTNVGRHRHPSEGSRIKRTDRGTIGFDRRRRGRRADAGRSALPSPGCQSRAPKARGDRDRLNG